MKDIPKWIPDSTICDWCRQPMALDTAGLMNNDKAVQAWYQCINDACAYLKRFGKPSRYGSEFTGGFVDAWKAEVKKKKEEKEVIQKEIVTPTEVKVG